MSSNQVSNISNNSILIINNSNKSLKNVSWTLKIKKIMDSLLGPNNVIVNNENEMNLYLKRYRNKIKGIILGGSELRIRKPQFVKKLVDNILPIMELNVPVLAVCYGHQIMGSIYQSKLGSSSQKILGHKNIKLLPDKLFGGLRLREYVYCSHYDYLIDEPMYFKSIARDDNGMIYAIKHYNKPIYGVQFHPEFSKYGKGIQIYKNFLKICRVKYNDLEYKDIPEVKHAASRHFIN